jgi:ribosomal protein S18 acetylase RimI-like enzyme
MADLLRWVPFAKELLAKITGFSCGAEAYERELREWLFNEAEVATTHGTKVWLYFNQSGEFVGYSSLSLNQWKYPDPKSPKVPVAVIPNVAIDQRHFGKPEGPPEARYSAQIMEHLVEEANALPGQPAIMGLFVHSENKRAIRFYEKYGFTVFWRTYQDPATKTVYHSMVRPLRVTSEGNTDGPSTS